MNLTPQQIAVRDLLVRGYTNKEIAVELSKTHTSIQKMMSAIMRKYDCMSRAEVIAKHYGLRG